MAQRKGLRIFICTPFPYLEDIEEGLGDAIGHDKAKDGPENQAKVASREKSCVEQEDGAFDGDDAGVVDYFGEEGELERKVLAFGRCFVEVDAGDVIPWRI